MQHAIEVSELSKCYNVDQEGRKGDYSYGSLRESLARWATAPLRRWRGNGAERRTEEFWALRDVSFAVRPGEVVGIIGRNGAGKSTLLKILSEITRPTRGEVKIWGRVGSLLEVGTGFHPELTGRENVFLNGAILGMTRREIARKFDDIVSFAGVEKFLDTPVKRYSSGMYVRLAFAVAAHLEPEILLVDEVLAVGDQGFQKRCVGKMGEISHSGRTVLLVSHNLPMVAHLSTSAVWMDRGQLRRQGPASDVISAYCAHTEGTGDGLPSVDLRDHPGRSAGMARVLRRVSLFDLDDNPTTTVPLGGDLVVEVEVGDMEGRSDTNLVLDIADTFGTRMAQAHSQHQSTLDLSGVEASRVRCVLSDLRLLPGDYVLSVAVGDCEDHVDRVENAIPFTVAEADIYGTGHVPRRRHGLIALSARWDAQHSSAGIPV